MSNDSDWVEDVRRWYFTGTLASDSQRSSTGEATTLDLGYEAAHPALQACNWPDAPNQEQRRLG